MSTEKLPELALRWAGLLRVLVKTGKTYEEDHEVEKHGCGGGDESQIRVKAGERKRRDGDIL